MKKGTSVKWIALGNGFVLFVCALFFGSCQKHPLQACFTFEPSNAIMTQTVVTFNASCSENADYVKWTFGDGTKDTIVYNRVFTISHVYAAPGSYTVKILALKDSGEQIWGKDEPFASHVVIVE